MFTSDRKMLELKNLLKSSGIIRFDKNFCDDVGILKQNLYQIENPEKINRTQHFTPEQIEKACKTYNVNANWIFGLSEEMYRKK